MAFQGIGYTGYDNARNRYVGNWMDTFSTGIMTSLGVGKPSDRTMDFEAEAHQPGGVLPGFLFHDLENHRARVLTRHGGDAFQFFQLLGLDVCHLLMLLFDLLLARVELARAVLQLFVAVIDTLAALLHAPLFFLQFEAALLLLSFLLVSALLDLVLAGQHHVFDFAFGGEHDTGRFFFGQFNTLGVAHLLELVTDQEAEHGKDDSRDDDGDDPHFHAAQPSFL